MFGFVDWHATRKLEVACHFSPRSYLRHVQIQASPIILFGYHSNSPRIHRTAIETDNEANGVSKSEEGEYEHSLRDR